MIFKFNNINTGSSVLEILILIMLIDRSKNLSGI
jgi:hypothetical protein